MTTMSGGGARRSSSVVRKLSRASSSRSSAITVAPSADAARASARPMPEAAPVMAITRSASKPALGT